MVPAHTLLHRPGSSPHTLPPRLTCAIKSSSAVVSARALSTAVLTLWLGSATAATSSRPDTFSTTLVWRTLLAAPNGYAALAALAPLQGRAVGAVGAGRV